MDLPGPLSEARDCSGMGSDRRSRARRLENQDIRVDEGERKVRGSDCGMDVRLKRPGWRRMWDAEASLGEASVKDRYLRFPRSRGNGLRTSIRSVAVGSVA